MLLARREFCIHVYIDRELHHKCSQSVDGTRSSHSALPFEKCRTSSNRNVNSSLVIQYILFVKILWWACSGTLWRFKSIQACQTAQLSQTYYMIRPELSIPFRTAVFFHAISYWFQLCKILFSFYQFYQHEDGTILAFENKDIRG